MSDKRTFFTVPAKIYCILCKPTGNQAKNNSTLATPVVKVHFNLSLEFSSGIGLLRFILELRIGFGREFIILRLFTKVSGGGAK